MNRDEVIDELLAKQQIMDAMARYSRGIDRRDEAMVRSAYHEDSTDDHGFGLAAGGWDIAALVRRDGNGFPDEWKQSTHFLGQHLITVDGDTAVSEVYFVSTTRTEDPDGFDWDQIVSGRYLDRWERRDGEFRISERTVIYDWIRTDKVPTRWPGPDHDVPKMCWAGDPINAAASTYGQPGPEDRSYEILDRTAVR